MRSSNARSGHSTGFNVPSALAAYGERVRNRFRVITQGGSRMREFRSYGSVRGALSNGRPYRDSHLTSRVSDLTGRFERPTF